VPEPVGFVREVRGDRVSFFLSRGVTVSFGEMVRIDSGSRGFYARVVDAGSSSTLKTDEQLREADGKESFGPYSSYRHVDAVLFLEKEAERVRSPTFNPEYMDKVHRLTKDDYSILRLAGRLEIGRLRSGGHVLGSVGLGVEAIPLMMGMFGMTGCGKTNCELMLNARIIDSSPQTVALIFDFAGQLLEGKGISPQRGLRDHPLFHTAVRFYSVRERKMLIGLYTIQPSKLYTFFPDITHHQVRLAQKLYKTLGSTWIEQSQEAYSNNGYSGSPNSLTIGVKL
jgi:hypothetical protein